jgi:Ricin-type beta-trefoil lectin domain
VTYRHRLPTWFVTYCAVAVLTMSAGSLLTASAVAAGGQGVIADLNTDLCLQATSAGSVSTQGCDGKNRQNWKNELPNQWLVNAQTGRCLTAYRDGTVAARSCRKNVPRQEWNSFCVNSIVQWTSVAYGKNLASFKNGSVDLQPQGNGNFQKWLLGAGFQKPPAC